MLFFFLSNIYGLLEPVFTGYMYVCVCLCVCVCVLLLSLFGDIAWTFIYTLLCLLLNV